MSTKTVAERVTDVELGVSGLTDRVSTLEANGGTGDGGARLSELESRVGALEGTSGEPVAVEAESRLDAVVDLIDRFIANVGDIYPGAIDDIEALKALDTRAVPTEEQIGKLSARVSRLERVRIAATVPVVTP